MGVTVCTVHMSTHKQATEAIEKLSLLKNNLSDYTHDEAAIFQPTNSAYIDSRVSSIVQTITIRLNTIRP